MIVRDLFQRWEAARAAVARVQMEMRDSGVTTALDSEMDGMLAEMNAIEAAIVTSAKDGGDAVCLLQIAVYSQLGLLADGEELDLNWLLVLRALDLLQDGP